MSAAILFAHLKVSERSNNQIKYWSAPRETSVNITANISTNIYFSHSFRQLLLLSCGHFNYEFMHMPNRDGVGGRLMTQRNHYHYWDTDETLERFNFYEVQSAECRPSATGVDCNHTIATHLHGKFAKIYMENNKYLLERRVVWSVCAFGVNF